MILSRLGITRTFSDGRSCRWRWNTRKGRFGFGFILDRHAYRHSADRWVFQPLFLYDRKEKGDS